MRGNIFAFIAYICHGQSSYMWMLMIWFTQRRLWLHIIIYAMPCSPVYMIVWVMHGRCNIMWRWVYDHTCRVSQAVIDWGTVLPFHQFYRPLVSRLLHLQAYMQGVGRHSQPEVLAMGQQDLTALSDFLGRIGMSLDWLPKYSTVQYSTCFYCLSKPFVEYILYQWLFIVSVNIYMHIQ